MLTIWKYLWRTPIRNVHFWWWFNSLCKCQNLPACTLYEVCCRENYVNHYLSKWGVHHLWKERIRKAGDESCQGMAGTGAANLKGFKYWWSSAGCSPGHTRARLGSNHTGLCMQPPNTHKWRLERNQFCDLGGSHVTVHCWAQHRS